MSLTSSAGPVLPPPIAILPSTLSPTQTTRSLPELHGNMANSTDQLALTKTNRAPTVSTSTRQAVPAFLNKLYNMVSNPETDELVRWSDEGDSFFIPSHERLSKELLPRFFKHGNFSSFVRQLNMYGFHKVPHLQQGVLQNSTESELWQFQNPHFQRGQPDLLCLITRKKTGGNADGVNVEDTQHSNHAIGPSTNTNQSSGPMDMTVLTSSLSAIKKHQTSLSAELKSLQESNQHLWNEALAARDRHKKHQDTINKILKFLASVFGNGASGAPGSGPGGNTNAGRDGRASPGALVPRKRPRLMIENGIADDDDDDDDMHFVNPSPNMSMQDDHEMLEGRISEAPTEVAPSPASSADTAPGKVKTEPPSTPGLSSVPPTSLGVPLPAQNSAEAPQMPPPASAATPTNTVARRSPVQSINITPNQESAPDTSSSNTPESLFGSNDEQAQEQLYQETISKLLSSPNALQRILASLSSQGPDGHHPAGLPISQSELAPYYGGLMNMNLDPPPDPSISYNAARLDQSTEALGEEIDNVNQDINSLMREWGISPDMLQEHPTDGNANNGAGVNGFNAQPNLDVNGFIPSDPSFLPNGTFPGADAVLPDHSLPYASIAPEGESRIDIDSFFNQFEFPDSTNDQSDGRPPSGSAFPVSLPAEFDLENPGAQPAAFLDEVHAVPSAASDTSLSPAIPLLDDFGGTTPGLGIAGVGIGARQTSPTRLTTTGANGTVPILPTNAPVVPTAPAPVHGTKRGRKRRSVTIEAPAEEFVPITIRPTRHVK
ncbi:unnamed protein product [Rhizoctonia solani]|nr:unnamed protein product [Rhizoctonia solani]